MPGDKKHHTDKFRRCVEDVKGKGHSEDSAYAICTTSLQNAGEAIFEGAEARALESFTPATGSHLEELHLCGAAGPIRYETLNGRKHIVVPIIALMEGVIHPVNAETPEFVPAATLERAAASWVGRPVTLGHPVKGGKQCSASDPEIHRSHGVGVIMLSEFKGRKLHQEAWIDDEKAKKVHPEMHRQLEEGKVPVEVSVGAFVVTDPKNGDFNGKRYKAQWLAAQGDHLALLPGGRGACSCEMGCGTHRAAMHFVAAESIELLPQLPALAFTALAEQSLTDRIQAINVAVNDRWNKKNGSVEAAVPSDYAYPLQVFDDRVIVQYGAKAFSADYAVDSEGKVTLGEPREVRQQWVDAAAHMMECPTCHGTGQVKNGTKQQDCPMCEGNGEVKMKTAAGARHSASDMVMIQAMHDHAVNLGAICDRKNLETAAAGPSIKNEGGCYALYASDGKRKLAEYATRKDAEDHQAALIKALARRAS